MKNNICKARGYKKSAKCKKLCGTHYERLRRRGNIYFKLSNKDRAKHLRDYKFFGENSPAAKLNLFQVDEIRYLYDTNIATIAELARNYKVTEPNIRRIVRRETWVASRRELQKV